MIRNIVFDLGGVLVDWDPKNLYRKIFNDESMVDYFLDNVCTYEWNLEQDHGRTIEEATREKITEFPQYEQEIKAYYDRWPEMFSGTIQDNVAILREYLDKEGFQVYALTNWSRETFPIALEKFPFFGDFHGVVVSGVEKIIKPDPAIYQILLNRYNLNPVECVFIDDRLENVEAARKLHLKGIHYRSSAVSLQDELDRITV